MARVLDSDSMIEDLALLMRSNAARADLKVSDSRVAASSERVRRCRLHRSRVEIDGLKRSSINALVMEAIDSV